MHSPITPRRNWSLSRVFSLLTAIALVAVSTGITVKAQCPVEVFASGLRAPTKIILSQKQNLLVAEQGTAAPNTGRISIIDPTSGAVRTLLDGLPSALNLIGAEPAPSGPSGLALRGPTLYVTIGSGNTTLPGPLPGEEVPNPDVSSPLFSSVLEMYFSAQVEQTTAGFTLTAADQLALKNGARLILDNGNSDRMVIKVLADFPDYVPGPVEGFVVSSNPFGIVRSADQLYVVDASLNLLATVDPATGATSVLTHFENVPNTLPFGPPTVQPVPDSIHFFGDQLLVPYLTGFPFGPGAAQVRTVNPTTGENGPFITHLTTAIDVLPVAGGGPAGKFLVLEFGGQGLVPPGRLLLFASPDATPTVIADCLTTPTSMVLDQRHRALFITEIGTGNVLQFRQ
jgi:hypothetical protein